ncbi:condensation domain-containing protein [Streptomyces chartreusis]|nr:condensation domain-containing protein [Streptomyces chartreusis]
MRAVPADGTVPAQWVELAVPAGLDRAALVRALRTVLDTHAMLRCRIGEELVVGEPGAPDAAGLIDRVDAEAPLDDAVADAVSRLDPAEGVLVRLQWADAGAESRLVVVVHELVVDDESWRILVSDLRTAYEGAAAGQEPVLEPESTSYRRWARLLAEQATADARVEELDGWAAQSEAGEQIPAAGTEARATWSLTPEITAVLTHRTPETFHCEPSEVVLAALVGAVAEDGTATVMDLEISGRQPFDGADPSRTVGRFAHDIPVRVELAGLDLGSARAGGAAAGELLKTVKEQVRAVPGDGLGYGLLRHLNPQTAARLSALAPPTLAFGYHGLAAQGTGEPWQPLARSAVRLSAHALRATAELRDTPNGPELTLELRGRAEELDRLGRAWQELLGGLAAHTEDPAAGGHTPSDFSLLDLAQSQIEELEAQLADDQ